MDKSQFNTISSELSYIGKEVQLRSQQTTVHHGEVANKLYLIKQGGFVLLHVHPKTGKERAINFFIPSFHPIATVSESFMLNTPSKYHLKTFTNTIAVEIDKVDYERYMLVSENRELMIDFGIRTLLEKNELRALLISLTAEEMLQHLHQEHPEILQQVPSKYVADFLGITPQWLSKLKHKL